MSAHIQCVKFRLAGHWIKKDELTLSTAIKAVAVLWGEECNVRGHTNSTFLHVWRRPSYAGVSRNRVARPRKVMKPTTSVTVVRTTPPAMAGSMPKRFWVIGIINQARAGT